jgi:hypothetical protein
MLGEAPIEAKALAHGERCRRHLVCNARAAPTCSYGGTVLSRSAEPPRFAPLAVKGHLPDHGLLRFKISATELPFRLRRWHMPMKGGKLWMRLRHVLPLAFLVGCRGLRIRANSHIGDDGGMIHLTLARLPHRIHRRRERSQEVRATALGRSVLGAGSEAELVEDRRAGAPGRRGEWCRAGVLRVKVSAHPYTVSGANR